MAEEKEEKRKPGIVRRIIKWIGLGLLTLLIISGLVFQAPWKAITLLLIIMSACTVLPKPVRKWFWLSVGVVIIALVIWVFLPEDTEGWRPYTFDEELAAMEARRAVPDEENAAIIYNQLLEDYNEAAFEPNFLDPNLEGLTRKEPWSSKDYPEAAQWLKQHGNTIAKLVEASKIEKCRFPIAANPIDLSETTDRFAPMRRWAQLLIRAGNNDLGEGRPDEAIEKFSCALQMAKHFYQQPMMIDLLVGISVEALATSQFNTFIITENPTEEHLSIIEKALAEIKHNWAADLSKILDTEKLLNKNLLAMFYEINDMGKLRFRRNLQSLFPTELEITFGYWWKKLVKASHILWWFYMPSTPQKAGEIIDAGWQRLYAKAHVQVYQKDPFMAFTITIFGVWQARGAVC
jgi:tetratricopeptide (TPR) repeat protein